MSVRTYPMGGASDKPRATQPDDTISGGPANRNLVARALIPRLRRYGPAALRA